MNVSVVIPCYNVAAYLAEAVESIRDQAPEAPIYLVDNNSSDNTLEVIQALCEQWSHIHALEEKTPGAPAARNTGIQAVQTEWVQFLDADDLLMPQAFQLRDQPDADLVVGAYHHRSVQGEDTLVVPNADHWKGLFDTDLGITSSILFRTRMVREVGGWDASLKSSQEYDLMFRCVQQGARVVTIQAPTAVVRERESGQISQSDPAPRWHRYLDLRGQMLAHLATNEPTYFEAHKSAFYQQLFDHIRTLSNSDPRGAIKRYREMIPKDFVPQASPATGSTFLKLMNLFGFAGATRIRKMLP